MTPLTSDELANLTISIPEPPNLEIWIAKDLCLACTGHYNWFHKIMAKLLLGWKVKDL